MMTLAELLDAGLQLPGDAWTMLLLWCFTPMGDVHILLWSDPGGAKYLFITNIWMWPLKYKVLTLDSWWQRRIPGELVAMLSLLNLPNMLHWRTCCFKWWNECNLVGGLSLPFGQTHWKICQLQEGGWILLGCTFTPHHG